MKCEKCGFVSNTDFKFCERCGTPATEKVLTDFPTPRILAFIKDDLFFVICILLTASVAFSLISGGFNVLTLLITIFAWLTYAGGRKNIVEHKHIKVISGTVYASYIINLVVAIILAASGVLYTLLILLIPHLSEISIDTFITEELGPALSLSTILITLVSAMAIFLGGFLILLAVILLIINIAGRKKIHRFIQSIYKSAETGEENFVGTSKVKTWIIIFAVISIISAVSLMSSGNAFGFLSEGAYAATLIILNILVGKHLCDE